MPLARPLIAVTVALMAAPLAAQPDSAEAVISEQLDDFRAGDVLGAWDHASPGIQGLFGSADLFGEMVRNGYPMVWQPRRYAFAGSEARDGRLYQQVEIEDATGRIHLLEYAMIPTEDGWKVDGVRPLQASAFGA